jgi:uroporphyrinogen-III synthase
MKIDRPLQGKRIAITRPGPQARNLIDRLNALGAIAVATPTIAIAPPADYAPLDYAITRLADYNWIIATSANGVQALCDRMATLGVNGEALHGRKIGAIGPATAQAFAEQGITPDFIPSTYVAEGILEEIGDVAEQRILLPRADIAREVLAAGLRERGALVNEIAAYRTVPGDGIVHLARLLRDQALDAITFTSSSTVRYLIEGLAAQGLNQTDTRDLLQHIDIICIGPITTSTANEEGLRVSAVAHEYTSDGLVAALVRHFGGATG